jgi:hypothetical protein
MGERTRDLDVTSDLSTVRRFNAHAVSLLIDEEAIAYSL